MARAANFSIPIGLAVAAAVAAVAQTSSSVRVFSEPTGLSITIDGQTYFGGGNFIWPAGSKHHISASDQEGVLYGKDRYVLKEWDTNLGKPVSVWPITAHPDLRYVKAVFEVHYAVTVTLGVGGPSPAGVVYLKCGSGTYTVTSTQEIYCRAGDDVIVEAHPHTGFVFLGWVGLGPTATKAFLSTFRLNRPQTVTPNFQLARPVELSVDTSPPGLKILLDRQEFVAPAAMEWGLGSTHTVGTFPDQFDANGQVWVFDSWSDGGGINHSVTVEPENTRAPLTMVARFVPGATVTFLTSPPGLRLGVDGRENWPNYTFRWATGSTHAIAAPPEQIDAQGRKYRFQSWSTGAAASHQFAVPAERDVRVTAVYESVAQLSIVSSPSGVSLQLDGGSCKTPCSLERPVGAKVRIEAPELIEVSEDTRYVFDGWSDRGERSRTVVTTDAPQKMAIQYRTDYRLVTLVTPPESAVWKLEPGSASGFYPADSAIAFRVEVARGFALQRIAGGFKNDTGMVMLDGPKVLEARLEPVPQITPAGVRNAAVPSAEAAVAPGSLISVFGASLAPHGEAGPPNPLVQAIAGVTVEIDGVLLPLIFVSPALVNAQLPFDLAPGEHRLLLRSAGKQSIVNFESKRNAPGLFGTLTGDITVGLFVRPDGSAVSVDNPASTGETLTLIGTGFGPLEPAAPLGFAVSPNQGFRLADAVRLSIAGLVVENAAAGPSPLGAGLNSIQFTVPAGLPPGNAPVSVTAGEAESNTVVLPLR